MMRTTQAHRSCTLVIVALFTLSAWGCGGKTGARDADLHIQSRANPQDIEAGGFDHGIYSLDGRSAMTVLLTDGPVENPHRALIVRMFWRPKAAATPLDETATNATVQYIVFNRYGGADNSAEKVGIYSGGGFVYPENDMGSPRLQANLWQATLTLADNSEGFEDTLGASILRGRFTAQRDDEGITDAVRRVNIAVSEALGVPRFVSAD
jgi:hypothetical protein